MNQTIEVTTEVRVQKGTGKTGAAYEFRKQVCYLHTPGAKYPKEFVVMLDKEQQPYSQGVYQLKPDSIYVNKYGELEIRPRLEPRAGSVPSAATKVA